MVLWRNEFKTDEAHTWRFDKCHDIKAYVRQKNLHPKKAFLTYCF